MRFVANNNTVLKITVVALLNCVSHSVNASNTTHPTSVHAQKLLGFDVLVEEEY